MKNISRIILSCVRILSFAFSINIFACVPPRHNRSVYTRAYVLTHAMTFYVFYEFMLTPSKRIKVYVLLKNITFSGILT